MSIKVKDNITKTSNFRITGIEKTEISEKQYFRVILESPDFRPVKMTVKKLKSIFSELTIQDVWSLLDDEKTLKELEESLNVNESMSIEIEPSAIWDAVGRNLKDRSSNPHRDSKDKKSSSDSIDYDEKFVEYTS